MNESSENKFNFERVSFAQIKELWELVANGQKRDRSYLKERYLRSAPNFEDTLEFLVEIKLIINSNDLLQVNLNDSDASHVDLKAKIIQALIESSKRSLVEFHDYLEFFVENGGRYSFQPSLNINLHTSGLRNLLLQLNFLEHEEETGAYTVVEKWSPYLKRYQKNLSARNLAIILRNQEILGTEAEKAVLVYEQEMLKLFPKLVSLIKHTAQDDVGAGYDIYSVRPNDENDYVNRYIEVKAVSSERDFYWSINEINTAKLYGSKYHLYLVPVLGNGGFDLNNLIIISDPYNNLFEQTSVREMESVSFHVSPHGVYLDANRDSKVTEKMS